MANQRLSPGVYRGPNGQLTRQANAPMQRPRPQTGGQARMAAPGWTPPANPMLPTPNMQQQMGGLGTKYSIADQKNYLARTLGSNPGIYPQGPSGPGQTMGQGMQIDPGFYQPNLADKYGGTGGGEPLPQGNMPNIPNDLIGQLPQDAGNAFGAPQTGGLDPGLAGPQAQGLPPGPYTPAPAMQGAPQMKPMPMQQPKPMGPSKGILSKPPQAQGQRVSPGVYRVNGKLVKR